MRWGHDVINFLRKGKIWTDRCFWPVVVIGALACVLLYIFFSFTHAEFLRIGAEYKYWKSINKSLRIVTGILELIWINHINLQFESVVPGISWFRSREKVKLGKGVSIQDWLPLEMLRKGLKYDCCGTMPIEGKPCHSYPILGSDLWQLLNEGHSVLVKQEQVWLPSNL